MLIGDLRGSRTNPNEKRKRLGPHTGWTLPDKGDEIKIIPSFKDLIKVRPIFRHRTDLREKLKINNTAELPGISGSGG
jgi:hypothetical protein